jgi:hypothetical protein
MVLSVLQTRLEFPRLPLGVSASPSLALAVLAGVTASVELSNATLAPSLVTALVGTSENHLVVSSVSAELLLCASEEMNRCLSVTAIFVRKFNLLHVRIAI